MLWPVKLLDILKSKIINIAMSFYNILGLTNSVNIHLGLICNRVFDLQFFFKAICLVKKHFLKLVAKSADPDQTAP